MNTPILSPNPNTPEPELIQQVAKELLAYRVVLIPTDTVYGIALIVSSETHPKELAWIKERPEEKDIPLLVSSQKDLELYSSALPLYAMELAARHWPGALTLVVRASDAIPKNFVANNGSIALRMPAHNITLALLNAVQAPLACSSANLSGKAPASSLDELDFKLAERVALMVDGGSLKAGQASTVVSCLGDEPKVLRCGPITIENQV